MISRIVGHCPFNFYNSIVQRLVRKYSSLNLSVLHEISLGETTILDFIWPVHEFKIFLQGYWLYIHCTVLCCMYRYMVYICNMQ